MEHAKRLLAGQELSIAEIAKATGYSSNAQMSRVFQRELGQSPRDYRKQFDTEPIRESLAYFGSAIPRLSPFALKPLLSTSTKIGLETAMGINLPRELP